MPAAEEPRTYLVECFWLGVNERRYASAVDRAQAAAVHLRREGAQVEFLGSILVQTDETVFWLFEGREADVRTASERAGFPFERVLEARITQATTDLVGYGRP